MSADNGKLLAQGDTDAAIAFLKHWAPNGHWVLGCDENASLLTRTFSAADEQQARKWIDAHQGKHNIYFSPNQPRRRISKKANKLDIGQVVTLHVDFDPARGTTDLHQERERILRAIEAYPTKPSVVLDSGGGYWAFWLLAAPQEIPAPSDGACRAWKLENSNSKAKPAPEDAVDLAAYRAVVTEIEAPSRAIAKAFGADHCFNIDRVARLPGTVNVPSEKKIREKGQRRALARVIVADWDLRYAHESFPKAAPDPAPSERVAVATPAGRREPEAWCVAIIADPLCNPDSAHDYDGHRSRAAFGICCELVRCGWADEEIEAVLTDPANGISDHVRKQKPPARYVARTIAKAREAAETRGGEGEKRTATDTLLELADPAALFHAADGTAFADMTVDGHRETWAVKGKEFRKWLTLRFLDETQRAPNAEAMKLALSTIDARASRAPERAVHVRVAACDGRFYLDLADAEWRTVEIDANGWRVVTDAPVRFRRSHGMLPLPTPTHGGSVAALWQFLNVRDDKSFALSLAWLRATFRNSGPFPILVLAGEQGSAKSTFSLVLRRLIDPNSAPLRALPREDRDLFIAARNGHVLCFDNVSGLAPWISDTLCRLSTGGGFAVRQLYTDDDEVLFDAQRPIILNGIEDVVTRPDLADRALFLMLEPIPDDQRRLESDLWDDFDRERPAILGALLDDVARGLQLLPKVRLATMPRMADFAMWAVACEGATGEFEQAYAGNRDNVVAGILDSDIVASAVRRFIANREPWEGNATTLLAELTACEGEATARQKTWPTDGARLSNRLRRAATFLRKDGIEIEWKTDGKRTIKLSHSEKAGLLTSAASAASKPNGHNASLADARDGAASGQRQGSVSPNPAEIGDIDATDATDAEMSPPLPGLDGVAGKERF